MTTYYMNNDLVAYEQLRQNYENDTAQWSTLDAQLQAQYDTAYTSYEEAHAAWETDPTDSNGDPISEPQPPERQPSPPKPQPPAPPSTTYDAVLVDAVTQIATATGQALVTPGRYVVTPSDGAGLFAVSGEELNAHYTDAAVPLPQVEPPT